MIKTVSDLLLQLAKAEAEKLDASDNTHAPTIARFDLYLDRS